MKSNKLTIGILAHVDAGKTTLSESILYKTGSIRKIGRVDHKDAFLDTYELEKTRGITIFSKQAVFNLGEVQVTLLDTPGHVDFSSEMERTLQVLDYAVLLINGADGIQGHTQTLWRLLGRYNIPTFIFVNKMDQIGTDRHDLLTELQQRFHEECIDFSQDQDWNHIKESVAVSDESILEKFLETEEIEKLDISRLVKKRKVFPVYFGSALKGEGVEALLEGLKDYTIQTEYAKKFGAKVFNISRDEQGNRLTHLKITGGTLQVKETLSNEKDVKDISFSEKNEIIWKEKVDQIRIYSGKQFQLEQEVVAGSICAVIGLSNTASGDGMGFEENNQKPVLEPVLSYRVVTQEGSNTGEILKNLRQLEEEEPHLNIVWNEKLAEIYVQVMGEIEIEILQSIIMERFGETVSFDSGNLVYKESIKEPVIGIGHFEPLRHYSEVHLLMEPGENGSGMVYELNCSEDLLSRNWQRLILTHLQEKTHIGVLTGSEITDMKISVIAGRGHNKHTEGGDFREATFRAVRQGLMQAESSLLEPVYEFRLEIPKFYLGRGISDIEKMYGRYDNPLIEAEEAVLTGVAPVATMLHYQTEVNAYTKGEGRLFLNLRGYEPCHNPEEIISKMDYEPEKDSHNLSSSVFCTKGSGYNVPWDQVTKHMHVDSGIKIKKNRIKTQLIKGESINSGSVVTGITDNEVEKIFLATFGPAKEKNQSLEGRIVYGKNRDETYDSNTLENNKKRQLKSEKEKYLLVDGYNIIFAWDNLKTLADDNLDLARLKLQDILSNYKSQITSTIILVFDAYKVKGNPGSTEKYHNIHVVYTKEAETADQYIERLVHIIRPEYDVTVATSDNVEQVIIMGKGGRRLTADGLKIEIDSVDRTIREKYLSYSQKVSQKMEIEKPDKNI